MSHRSVLGLALGLGSLDRGVASWSVGDEPPPVILGSKLEEIVMRSIGDIFL